MLKLLKKISGNKISISAGEQDALVKESDEKIAKVSNTEDQLDPNIMAVSEKTGWTYAYAEWRMKNAKEYLGVSFATYNKHNFFEMSLYDQAERYRKILLASKTPHKKKLNMLDNILDPEGLENAIVKVSGATGWSREMAKEKILDARSRSGCAYKEYVLYKFYEVEESEQERYFLIHDSKKLQDKYNKNQEFKRILRDKSKTNAYFENYVKRTWCVNTEVSEEEFIKKFITCKRVIYKPINGSGGHGIEAFWVNKDNIKELYACLRSYPIGVIEEYVVQHPEMNRLCSACINTVRVVSISSNSKPVTKSGKYLDLAYCAVRIGRGDSVVDNNHSGGMIAAVDQDTGKILTSAADQDGNVYEYHPVTLTAIKGFTIPYFFEAIELVRKIIIEKEIEGYLGWDVAISANGPVIIEVNYIPGVAALTIPHGIEKRGMKSLMEQYL